MSLHAIRLTDGQDLRRAIVAFAKAAQLKSGVILTAVGSLHTATIRMAGASPTKQDIREITGPLEIVSLTGTIASDGGLHLHISVSDKDGKVTGGHMKDGCLVHTTAEVVIASDEKLTFSRKVDLATGFDELIVEA